MHDVSQSTSLLVNLIIMALNHEDLLALRW